MQRTAQTTLDAFLERAGAPYSLADDRPLTPDGLAHRLPERLRDAADSPPLRRYWRRTLLRAVAARRLAAAARFREGDEAFVAALLADVGVALLLRETPDDYMPLYDGALAGDFDALGAERLVFKFDRRQLTDALLKRWGVPGSIATTIVAARDGGDSRFAPPPAARATYVAELFTTVLLDERADLWPELVAAAERHLRLTPEQLLELNDAVEAESRALVDDFLAPPSVECRLRDAEPQRATSVVAEPTAPPLRLERGATSELRDKLSSAAAICRTERMPICLALVEASSDDHGDLLRTVAALDAVCAAVDWPGATVTRLATTCGALVLPRCDRRRALDLFDELRRVYRDELDRSGASAKLGVGLAVVGLPPRDFPADEIVAAAERCLNAARSAAGDAAKSIELY